MSIAFSHRAESILGGLVHGNYRNPSYSNPKYRFGKGPSKKFFPQNGAKPFPNLHSQLWVTVTRVTVVSVNRDRLIWTQIGERKRLVYDCSGFE
jgi:hypothetical protein